MLDNNTPCPREYISHRTPYSPEIGSHGGCLIYVRQDQSYIPINLDSNLQATAVQVDLGRKYTICSLYLPPNNPVTYEELINLIRQLPRPFILMGDMNGRHPLWGDITSNVKGNLISSVIENEDLGVMNTGEPTHYHVQTGTLSCLDLSLGSSDCLLDFSWRTTDWYSSDHIPIILSLNNDAPKQGSPRWLLDKANWSLFKELSKIEVNVEDIPSVDEAMDVLNGTLHSAGVDSIPKTTGSFHRRPVPWWTDELKILHRATRTTLTRCRRHRTEENIIEYKRCRAKFRRMIKFARRCSWTKFVSSISSKTPQSVIWKKIQKIAGKYNLGPTPVLKINGQYITKMEEVSNILAEHFAQVSRESEQSPQYCYRIREEGKTLDFTPHTEEAYNLPFTMQEFDAALKNSRNTAPGPDDIPYEMLRHVCTETKLFIFELINRIWRDSSYPKIWEMATVLPFVKPGKDRFLPSSYRPIALTSCLCKVMERMVNTRLMWVLERRGILSPAQSGFRKMKSTTDVLLRLESSICEAFASKQHHVTVFFDLEKAYDTVWRYGILRVIHECGLRGELPLFIKMFLENRFFKVKVRNTLSDIKCQGKGVPQGSVLSVTLFALAINGITSVVPPGVMYTLFVDDFSVSFAGSRMAVVERKLQLTVNKIVEWAGKNGLRFSTSKTVAVHFCKIRGIHPDPDLYLNGQRIPCVEETRFLGLIFDNRLTWVPHLKSVKAKCLEALKILRVLSHTSWGSDREIILKLHKVLILSKLLYGCEVYSSATANHLKILDAVHHEGIRLATGAFKSSPVQSLLVDAGEFPLDFYFKLSQVRLWYRLQRLPDSLAFKTTNKENLYDFYGTHPRFARPFGYRVKEIIAQFNLSRNQVCQVDFSVTPPWKLPTIKYCRYFIGIKKEMLEEEIRNMFLEHATEHSNSTFIFTDGSKSNAGVGYGVYSGIFNRKGALPQVASNFTAELYAVLSALEKIITLNQRNFTIFIDSRSALQALEVFNTLHPIVVKILQWVFILHCRGQKVEFCWVPAHVGVLGNEKADSLAKKAVAELLPRRIPLPCSDFIPGIKKTFVDFWQQCWDSVNNNKFK